MNIEDNFEYDYHDSCVYVLKDNKRYRKVKPDDNMISNVMINGEKIRMKYSSLVWLVVHKVRPTKDQVIFHKDLDETNCTIENLVLISKKEKSKISEAMKNITGSLRLIPHPTDVFSYVLEYRENGRLKREVIADIVPAKKKLMQLRIKIIKFLNKYVVST